MRYLREVGDLVKSLKDHAEDACYSNTAVALLSQEAERVLLAGKNTEDELVRHSLGSIWTSEETNIIEDTLTKARGPMRE